MNSIITVPIANLYAEPDKTSTLIDEALMGWPIQILEEKGNFYHINTFYNYMAYVEKTDITQNVNFEPNHVIIKNFADISQGETVQHRTITTLPFGAYVCVLKGGEKYSQILMANGETGFIRTQFLKPYTIPLLTLPFQQDKESLRQNIVSDSLRYMETQYRWGGKTPIGIDCSGLTFMCYLLNGIIIYRDAVMKEGFPIKEIQKESLQKADLIFWKGHVGMYIGDGLFIHSSDGNGGVAIDELEEKLNNNWEFVGYGSVF